MEDSNNNIMEEVNLKGKPLKTLNTQFKLLECLTDDMLNPLLHKFESHQIIQDIYNRRKNNKDIKTDYDITTNIVMKNKYNKPSLYINYYKGKEKVFHLSLHVCPSKEHGKQSILHFKQNTRKQKNIGEYNEQTISQNIPKRSIRISRTISNSIKFSLNKADKNTKNISPELIAEANVVIKVLNSYFNKKLPSFIQNKTLKTTKKAKYIKTEMNKSYKNYKGINRNPQY